MKKTLITLIVLLLLFGSRSYLFSCTAFYIAKDNVIFAGNNEDWFDYKTKMWVVPSEDGKFGGIYFGFSDFIRQGGINEKGLFFDGFATDPLEVVNSKSKPHFQGRLADHVMATCETVEEVVNIFSKYNLEGFKTGMLMFGDAYGKSVIIEGDEFIINKKGQQICTNFYQSKIKRSDIDCWRFLEAEKMLNTATEISIKFCKSILKAVHVDFTQYSNIYDLKNKKIYLYHYHNFNHVVEFDLQEELKKGERKYDIATLFPRNDEFMRRSISKKTPINNKMMLYFLIFSSVILIITPFGIHYNKKKISDTTLAKVENEFNLFAFFQINSIIVTLLYLILMIALAKNPFIFDSGLPQVLKGLSVVQIILIHIPLLMVILDLLMIAILIRVFVKRYWTNNLRTIYLCMTLIISVNLYFFNYWNLIRI